MRFLNLAALVLGVIRTGFASPIDAAATADLVNANRTVPFINQTFVVAQVKEPKVPKDAPKCKRNYGFFTDGYVIKIPKLPKDKTMEVVCAKLWEGLKGHNECPVISPHGCGVSDKPGEADVQWHFRVPWLCMSWSIQDAFNWATEGGKYGGKLNCIADS